MSSHNRGLDRDKVKSGESSSHKYGLSLSFFFQLLWIRWARNFPFSLVNYRLLYSFCVLGLTILCLSPRRIAAISSLIFLSCCSASNLVACCCRWIHSKFRITRRNPISPNVLAPVPFSFRLSCKCMLCYPKIFWGLTLIVLNAAQILSLHSRSFQHANHC